MRRYVSRRTSSDIFLFFPASSHKYLSSINFSFNLITFLFVFTQHGKSSICNLFSLIIEERQEKEKQQRIELIRSMKRLNIFTSSTISSCSSSSDYYHCHRFAGRNNRMSLIYSSSLKEEEKKTRLLLDVSRIKKNNIRSLLCSSK